MRTLREEVLNARSTVCLERARIYTEVYRQNEDKPVIIKRALAIRKTLEEMSIFIEPGALIVGNQASKLRSAPIFPEYAVEWIEKEIDEFDKRPGDKFFIEDDQKEELRELCSYWRGKTTLRRGRYLMGETLREIHKTTIIKAEGNLTSGDAHIAVNMERVLQIGLDGYLAEIRGHLHEDFDTSLEQIKQRRFYQAAEIAITGLSDFILRFSRLARALSIEETDQTRKQELVLIADNCEHITGNLPDTFYQALQLTYFLQLVLQIESNGHSVSLGRLDQYLFPFYIRDREQGILSEEFALELLENTWIKLLSINKIRPWSHTRFSAGGPLYQNVTIGRPSRQIHRRSR